ncbi:MAG: beta-propeller domain-containing protein [Clostridia bacterium]|nr:beta-propeller domain-containing protein [Clostridia bacterium]
MKDNKDFINGIYQKYDEYLKERSNGKMDEENKSKFNMVKNVKTKEFRKGSFLKRNFVKVLSTAAVCTVVISSFIVSKNFVNNEDTNNIQVGKTTTLEEISLNKVNDFETFYKIVKDNTNTNTRNIENNFLEIAPDSVQTTEDSAKSTNGANAEYNFSDTQNTSSSDDYSKTNIQVENVDEADIVKTNGKYIFYVVSNKIVIVDIQNKAKMEKVAEITFENDDFKPSELYIYKDKIIVIGNESGYSTSKSIVRETLNSIYKKGIYRQNTTAIVYDISYINEPEEERRVKIEGRYVSSRMIDGNIYFVANKSISGYDIVKHNVEDLDENAYKPAYTDTAVSTREKLVDFDRVYYFDNIETLNYLNLGGFNVNNEKEADVEVLMGAGDTIFCSTENLYVAKARNVYDADTRMNFGKDTKILKFSLNNGNIEFKAEADIEGGINNQFSMDEQNGYFRIATTVGKTYNMDNSTSNSLYILDEKLNEVGRLDGIAKGEKIYSVRYAGDRAYVVTFKEIDPLFVIDLSNVRNPKILGELKIPGYSTYLHPYDETHVIGFGYDTKPNSSNTGVVNDGIKMSMFDITDFNNPKEMFTVKIGDRRTSSALTHNHKALLFDKEKNLIAFPISTYESGKTEYKAQVYDIDLAKGFTLRGEIKHEKEQDETSSKGYYYTNYNLNIERIIYSQDVFYTLSKAIIKASDMNSLQEIDVLNISK